MFSNARAYEHFMGAWSRLLAPLFVRFVGVKDDDAVLDVGCGTGALTEAILEATKSGRVTGIDPSREYVDASKKKHPRAMFEVGSATELPFGDGSFDRTVSALVLNFVPEHARAVEEMRRSGELAALWRSAGLGDVEEAPLFVERSFESFLDWWAPFLLGQGPAGAFVKTLSDERRIELEDRLRARLGEDAFVLKARAWAVKGTRT